MFLFKVKKLFLFIFICCSVLGFIGLYFFGLGYFIICVVKDGANVGHLSMREIDLLMPDKMHVCIANVNLVLEPEVSACASKCDFRNMTGPRMVGPLWSGGLEVIETQVRSTLGENLDLPTNCTCGKGTQNVNLYPWKEFDGPRVEYFSPLHEMRVKDVGLVGAFFGFDWVNFFKTVFEHIRVDLGINSYIGIYVCIFGSIKESISVPLSEFLSFFIIGDSDVYYDWHLGKFIRSCDGYVEVNLYALKKSGRLLIDLEGRLNVDLFRKEGIVVVDFCSTNVELVSYGSSSFLSIETFQRGGEQFFLMPGDVVYPVSVFGYSDILIRGNPQSSADIVCWEAFFFNGSTPAEDAHMAELLKALIPKYGYTYYDFYTTYPSEAVKWVALFALDAWFLWNIPGWASFVDPWLISPPELMSWDGVMDAVYWHHVPHGIGLGFHINDLFDDTHSIFLNEHGGDIWVDFHPPGFYPVREALTGALKIFVETTVNVPVTECPWWWLPVTGSALVLFIFLL